MGSSRRDEQLYAFGRKDYPQPDSLRNYLGSIRTGETDAWVLQMRDVLKKMELRQVFRLRVKLVEGASLRASEEGGRGPGTLGVLRMVLEESSEEGGDSGGSIELLKAPVLLRETETDKVSDMVFIPVVVCLTGCRIFFLCYRRDTRPAQAREADASDIGVHNGPRARLFRRGRGLLGQSGSASVDPALREVLIASTTGLDCEHDGRIGKAVL